MALMEPCHLQAMCLDLNVLVVELAFGLARGVFHQKSGSWRFSPKVWPVALVCLSRGVGLSVPSRHIRK